MKRIKKFFTYVIALIATPKEFSKALNVASSPEELDVLVCGEEKE